MKLCFSNKFYASIQNIINNDREFHKEVHVNRMFCNTFINCLLYTCSSIPEQSINIFLCFFFEQSKVILNILTGKQEIGLLTAMKCFTAQFWTEFVDDGHLTNHLMKSALLVK